MIQRLLHVLLVFYLIAALAFNYFSHVSASQTPPQPFTLTKPLQGSVSITLAIALVLLLEWRLPWRPGVAVVRVLVAAALTWRGILPHLQYHYAERHHPSAWVLAVLLNVFAALILVGGVVWEALAWAGQRFGVARVASATVVLIAVAAGVGAQQYGEYKRKGKEGCFDVPPWFLEDEKNQQQTAKKQEKCTPKLAQSRFVEGQGGVPIAVDVYLPCGYDAQQGGGLPLYFHVTRYGRRLSVRWPFSLVFGTSMNTRSKHYVNEFVGGGKSFASSSSSESRQQRNYALVTMDVRGSGASGGSRTGDLLAAEVDDMVKVLEWAKAQPFYCKGCKVVSGGISYDGMTAATLAARGVLDVLYLVFSPLNVYSELAFPGGVPCVGFVDGYGVFTSAVERAQPVPFGNGEVPMGLLARFFFNAVFDGPSPPTLSGSLHGDAAGGKENKDDAAERQRLTRKHIYEQHVTNLDIRGPVRAVQFSGDVVVPGDAAHPADYTAQELGISDAHLANITAHARRDKNFVVYSYSGYYDSGSIRGSAAIFAAMRAAGREENVKVLLGPWIHGMRRTSSPFVETRVSCFPLVRDMRRFADYESEDDVKHKKKKNRVNILELQSNEWIQADDMNWALPLAKRIDEKKKNDEKKNEQKQAAKKEPDSNNREVVQFTSIPKSHTLIVASMFPFIRVKPTDGYSFLGMISRWNLVQHVLQQPVTSVVLASKVNADAANGKIAKFELSLSSNTQNKNNNDENENEVARHFLSTPIVRVKMKITNPTFGMNINCFSEASLFFYLMLLDDKNTNNSTLNGATSAATTKQEMRRAIDAEKYLYLTEGAYRVGHRPLDDAAARRYDEGSFEHVPLDTELDLEVALEPLAFSFFEKQQRLVLVVSRKSDADFLAPHPVCSGSESEHVQIRDLTVSF